MGREGEKGGCSWALIPRNTVHLPSSSLSSASPPEAEFAARIYLRLSEPITAQWRRRAPGPRILNAPPRRLLAIAPFLLATTSPLAPCSHPSPVLSYSSAAMTSWSSAHLGSHTETEDVPPRPLTPAMLQAGHYGMFHFVHSFPLHRSHMHGFVAETGRVCIGPIGAPVTGRDRQMLRVIQELEPLVMGNWYVVSSGCRYLLLSACSHMAWVVGSSPRMGPDFTRASSTWARTCPWSKARITSSIAASMAQRSARVGTYFVHFTYTFTNRYTSEGLRRRPR